MARRSPCVLPFPVALNTPVSEPPHPELFSPDNLFTPDNLVIRLTHVLLRATRIASEMGWCPPVKDRLFANVEWFELALDSLEAHLAERGMFDGLTRTPGEIRKIARRLRKERLKKIA